MAFNNLTSDRTEARMMIDPLIMPEIARTQWNSDLCA